MNAAALSATTAASRRGADNRTIQGRWWERFADKVYPVVWQVMHGNRLRSKNVSHSLFQKMWHRVPTEAWNRQRNDSLRSAFRQASRVRSDLIVDERESGNAQTQQQPHHVTSRSSRHLNLGYSWRFDLYNVKPRAPSQLRTLTAASLMAFDSFNGNLGSKMNRVSLYGQFKF